MFLLLVKYIKTHVQFNNLNERMLNKLKLFVAQPVVSFGVYPVCLWDMIRYDPKLVDLTSIIALFYVQT